MTLPVNAVAGVDSKLEQTSTNADFLAILSLDSFSQESLISHIGDLDMSVIAQDMTLLIPTLLDTLNKDVPPLPIPVVAGIKLSNEAFVIESLSFALKLT